MLLYFKDNNILDKKQYSIARINVYCLILKSEKFIIFYFNVLFITKI